MALNFIQLCQLADPTYGARMSDETPTAEKSGDKMNEGQHVQHTVRQTIDYLRAGKVTRGEATDLRQAADRAITDHDVARAIR